MNRNHVIGFSMLFAALFSSLAYANLPCEGGENCEKECECGENSSSSGNGGVGTGGPGHGGETGGGASFGTGGGTQSFADGSGGGVIQPTVMRNAGSGTTGGPGHGGETGGGASFGTGGGTQSFADGSGGGVIQPTVMRNAGSGTTKVGSVDISINFGIPANENIDVLGRFSIYTIAPSSAIYTPQTLQYLNRLLDRLTIAVTRPPMGSSGSMTHEMYAAGDATIGIHPNNNTPGANNDAGGATPGQGTATLSGTCPDCGGNHSDMPGNTVRQVKLLTKDREVLIFNFPQNENTAKLSGQKAYYNYRLQMVNATGTPVTDNPTYYDMFIGDGYVMRYSAEDGQVISLTTPFGRTIKPDSPSVGLEIIYDESGNIKQVWSSAEGLADVVVTAPGNSYEIRIYPPASAGTKTNGAYVPTGDPHTVWKIENPNPGQATQVQVTKSVTVNGVTTDEVSLYDYSYAQEGWKLDSPDGLEVISQSTSWNYSKTVRTISETVKTAAGEIASKSTRVMQKFPFGDRTVVSTLDPEGANLQTVYTYYSSGGGIGRVETISYPDGNWVWYKYDDEGRVIEEIKPWKNSPLKSPASQARSITYSYAPLDSRDTVQPNDARPRSIEEKILGVTVRKEFNAYYFASNQYYEINQQGTTQDAAWNDAANLKTEKRYYAKGDSSSPSAGRLYRITYPNDTTETYTYAYGNWNAGSSLGAGTFTAGTGTAVKMTVTYGTTANPNGVANKTGQQVTIFDGIGNVVMKEKYVYTGSGFERFGWTAASYDAWMRPLAIKTSNNELTEYTWNCCMKTSETLPDGTQYTYAYDALKRLISKTKVGIGDQPDLVTSYTYDAQGRVLNTIVSGGNLSLSESSTYNYAGQITSTTDQSGLTSTYTYLNGSNVGSNLHGSIKITTKPGNITEIIEAFCDTNISSMTGSGQTSQYSDYGVIAGGLQWNKITVGSVDSPRWYKEYYDLLNRKIKIELPGANNSVLVAEYFYNTKNQLIMITSTYQPTIFFTYDSISELKQIGFDINKDGNLTAISDDVILLTNNSFIKENGNWYNHKTESTYATSNSNIITILNQKKNKLSGFNTDIITELEEIDIYGNVTLTQTKLNRQTHEMIIDIDVPFSSIIMQSKYCNKLLKSKKDSSGITVSYNYDCLERLIDTSNARTGTEILTYYQDGVGKKGKIKTEPHESNGYITYDYDSITGHIKSIKNSLNQYTYFAYNNFGEINKTWGDNVYPTEHLYNSYGDLIQIKTYRNDSNWTSPIWPSDQTNANITTWNYDIATGLIIEKIDAAGRSTLYDYYDDGRLHIKTLARKFNNQSLQKIYTYDALGKPQTIDYTDETPSISFTYNRIGKISTIIDETGIHTFSYSPQLTLQKEAIDGIYTKELNRIYSAAGFKGNYLGLSIGNTSLYSYRYDQYNRLNKIATASGNFDYTYLAESNLIASITRPNNVSTSYTYEPTKDLLTTVANGSISTFQYTNDVLGRRTSVSRRGSAFTVADILSYTYNSYSELTGASSNNNAFYNYSYNYDPIGNRKTAGLAGSNWSYTTNNLNQYTTINQTGSIQNPTYDADGNMLTRDGWTQTWNAENRLIKAEKGTAKLEFAYDFMGRRIEKKVYSGNSLTSHIRFVYDGYSLIEELDGLNNNATLRRYVWQAIQFKTPLTVFDAGIDKTYFYHIDAQKNITDLTNSAGEVVAHYEYSPFGQLVKSSGSYANTNVLTWSSEYYDQENNLIYYNYRYYSPLLGRWISKDLIDIDKFRNLYSFVNNNPINYTDSLGLMSLDSVSATMEQAILQGDIDTILWLLQNEGVYLTKAAVAAATAYLASVAYCESLWNYYKSFECRRCKGCWTREELFAMATICLDEVTGRMNYLRNKCDFILPGSIRTGSTLKENNHMNELNNKFRAALHCLDLAIKTIN
ncbi:RHS repeat-associated core domain-containing protein [Victivallis sp. Marseille-Q1083]|uniref:RHS repeat domain-containing protein n=1 Tax=Victivallis sp. Marseille-Q1083 TaxID=2717288 RepID=UPI00158B4D0C|nr:RHS repeat-associated core domain-containing protein [Victivallis sp. Marseille-Q1083]